MYIALVDTLLSFNTAVLLATCGHPLRHTTPQINDSESIHILGYKIPAGEGTVVSFSCLDLKLALIGPNSSTCMGNGQWKPDPSKVECKGIA